MLRTLLFTTAIGLLIAQSGEWSGGAAQAAVPAAAQSPSYLPESPYKDQRVQRQKKPSGLSAPGKAYVPSSLAPGTIQPIDAQPILPVDQTAAPAPRPAAPPGMIDVPFEPIPTMASTLPKPLLEPIKPLYPNRGTTPHQAPTAPVVSPVVAEPPVYEPAPPVSAPVSAPVYAAPSQLPPPPPLPASAAPDFKPYATIETQGPAGVDPRHYQSIPPSVPLPPDHPVAPAIAQPLPVDHYAPPPVTAPAPLPPLLSETPPEQYQALPEPVVAAPVEPPVTPEPMTPMAVPAAAPLEAATADAPASELSEETRRILSRLPTNIDGVKAAPGAKLDVKRYNPALEGTLDRDDEDVQSYEASGMSMQVRAPRFNSDYELEKAYNALIAGETEIAIEIYKDILDQAPNDKQALFGLATTYHRLGELDKARPVYGRLLRIDPAHREALNNFLVLVAEESPQEALRQLEALEQQNPEYSPIPAQMAILYDKLGYPDEARKKMIRASMQSPDNLVYTYNLAILLDKQERYADAAVLYSKLIAAANKGQSIPANPRDLQERLTFIGSNESQ